MSQEINGPHLETNGLYFLLKKAACATSLRNALSSHASGEPLHPSYLHSWLAVLQTFSLFRRHQIVLEKEILFEPIVITDGKFEPVPDAKICGVLVISPSEDYEGGEYNGAKIEQGGAVFYRPEDYQDFAPVTEGECKAYYFALK